MIFNEYLLLIYFYVFISIYFIFTFSSHSNKYSSISWIGALISITFICIYSSQRPVEIGADTYLYKKIFNTYSNANSYEDLPVWSKTSYAYYCFIKVVSFFGDQKLLFFTSSFIFISSLIFFLFFFLKKYWDIAFFFYLSTFTFYSFNFNIIRNSLIVGICFFSWYYFSIERSIKKFIILIIIASLIHNSALIVGVGILLSHYISSVKYSLFFWLFILCITVIGFDTFELVNNVVQTYGNDTLKHKVGVFTYLFQDYKTGLRIDFIFYTIVFGAIGLYFSNKLNSNPYTSLVKWYFIQSSFFIMFSSMPNNDRFGTLAWILIPIIVLYPLEKRLFLKQQKFLISISIFFFGIINMLFVAKYDFDIMDEILNSF